MAKPRFPIVDTYLICGECRNPNGYPVFRFSIEDQTICPACRDRIKKRKEEKAA